MGKVRLHATVKVHVMHDHSLLQAEWCASYPLFSQHVTSHLCACVCVSHPCDAAVMCARTQVHTDVILYVNVAPCFVCTEEECLCESIHDDPSHLSVTQDTSDGSQMTQKNKSLKH